MYKKFTGLCLALAAASAWSGPEVGRSETFPLERNIAVDIYAPGAIRAEISSTGAACEGLGMAEAFRGDVLVWVRLAGERIARCHLRDPSWFQWPLLEAVIEGNIVADFPLCNKSFNCSYSGHDL